MRNRTPDSSHRLYDELQSENTQALLDRLEAEMEKEEMDTDLVEALLEVLDEKAPIHVRRDSPEESLRKFKMKNAPMLTTEKDEKKSRPVVRIVARVALAACLCVVMAGAVAQACGIDLIGQFLEWREETFVLRGTSHGGQMVLDAAPEGEYTSLAEAVAAYGIADPVVPTWIPRGMELQSVRVKEVPYAIDLTARYVGDDDRKIVSKVYICLDESYFAIHSEHSEKDQPSYMVNGISFLITSNNEQYHASWVVGNCICSINGDLTESEIKQMINSIFTEER